LEESHNQQQEEAASREWAALPARVLLGMRSSIHGAVGGVLKMLQVCALHGKKGKGRGKGRR
jgi:hypothetical protein